MKICYLTNNIDPKNGWGRYASDLILSVKKMGHEVVILKEVDDGFEGEVLLKKGFGMFYSAFVVRKYFKDCDIVHALDINPYGITAFLANLFLSKKMIITLQGTYSIAPFYSIKTKYLAQLTSKSADAIIAISNFSKSEFFKKGKAKRVEVINHGIDLEKFYKERMTSGENYILSVGALKFRKGYHVSISAFSLVKSFFPDLKYKIVGSQRDVKYFERLQGVSGVEFLTNISDKELGELYSCAKLFVLTSLNEGHHFEGFGLVFLEASAAGLPVIGTFGNGIEDAVKDGYNGFLVPQNDIDKTANVIISTLSDPAKLQKMTQNSYNWAQQHDLSVVIRKYVDLYEDILK